MVIVGSASRVGSCVALGTTDLAFPQLWNDRLDEITELYDLLFGKARQIWQMSY